MKLTGNELAIHMETHDIYYVYQNSVKTIVLTHKKALSLAKRLRNIRQL